MSTPLTLAQRFAARLVGLGRAHGWYSLHNSRSQVEGRKVEGRAITLREPPTLDHYERHLSGEYGLGIVPIRDDGTVRWGAIDIDQYVDLDITAKAEESERLGLPLVMCRTKSGGIHAYLFCAEDIPAELVRSKLQEWSVALGFPRAEIFPKQTRLASDRDVGNWINMPYFNGMEGGRYAVMPDGGALDLVAFLNVADAVELSRAQLAKLTAPVLPGSQGGSVAPAVHGERAFAGRNEELTSLAGAMRRHGTGQAAILAALREENSSRFDPPLPDVELQHIALGMTRYEPAAQKGDERSRFTDLGNARQLIVDHGPDILFVPGVGWLVWDGCRFAPDNTGGIDRLAKETVKRMLVQGATVAEDDSRKRAVNWAVTSHSVGRIKAMVELARTEAEVIAAPDDLDADPMLLNCRNGTIDLRTGCLREHDRGDLISKLAQVEFDSEATAPKWERFLERVIAPETIREFLQRAAGYSLTGLTEEQCLFLLYGLGANGKTTFLETLGYVMGDYRQAMNVSTLTSHTRSGQGPSEDIARVIGVRYITAVETGDGVAFNEVLLKQLTGGDTVTARHLYRPSFDFQARFKLWLGANHKPTIRGTDDAIWRRIHLVPFTEQIPEPERIRDLPQQLQAEASGILNWALGGLAAWRAEGLGVAEQVRAATKRYREEQDDLSAFMAARCVLDPEATVGATALYESYEDWCEQEDRLPGSQTSFGTRLSGLGFGKVRRQDGTKKAWVRLGLSLLPEAL
ncbi:MAG: phage/plasmid primase, P4 family [Gemmatimonadales bacterium]